jgi:arylsulfatase
VNGARPIFLLLCAALLCTCAGPRPADVILITVDTLRADRLGAYGYAVATPAMDGLAAQGRRFTQATTPFPRTSPAVASLFTGLRPEHHGSREIWQPFHTGTTMAEALAERGYETLAVSANPAAGRRQNLHRGFEVFVGADSLIEPTADYTTDAALELLRRADGDRPLFLWVHYMDPHFPYRPPDDFGDLSAGAQCLELMDQIEAGNLRMGHVEGDWDGRSSAALEDCSFLYDAEIAYTDRHLSRLLAALNAYDRLANGYVVFTSDHGENLGEDRLFYGHGASVHDASVRVPLIVAGPGIASGVDEEAVRLEDLRPTVLGLLGGAGESVPAVDGMDLSGRLTGRGKVTTAPVALIAAGSALNVTYFERVYSGRAHSQSCLNGPRFSLCAFGGGDVHLYDTRADPFLRRDVSERYPEERQRLLQASRSWQPEAVRERAVRRPTFKLVERPRLEGGYDRMLYDLRTDVAEAVDVAAENPQLAHELGMDLDRWDLPTPGAIEAMDAESLEALRSLGYVD